MVETRLPKPQISSRALTKEAVITPCCSKYIYCSAPNFTHKFNQLPFRHLITERNIMNPHTNKHYIKPIASALDFKQEQISEKSPQPIRRDYSGLPSTGFVRISQLCRNPKKPDAPAIIPVTAVTLWRWLKDPTKNFPKPVKLSANITAFRAEEIRAWLDQQAGN